MLQSDLQNLLKKTIYIVIFLTNRRIKTLCRYSPRQYTVPVKKLFHISIIPYKMSAVKHILILPNVKYLYSIFSSAYAPRKSYYLKITT